MAMIVVGVDGSEAGAAALRFAADEARARGARLRVVTAWHIPPMAYAGAGFAVMPGLDTELRKQAEKVADEAVASVGDDVAVDRVVRQGHPATVLLEAAQDADLLVVGSRGLGGFRGLLLGSVSIECAHRATCPITIVRAPEQAGGET